VTAASIILAIVSACLALAGIGLTYLGYRDVQREMAKPSQYADVARVRELIGEFMIGAKVWRTFLGVGLTAASVVVAAIGSVLGELGPPSSSESGTNAAGFVLQTLGIVTTLAGVAAALKIAVTGNRAADRRAEADRAAVRHAAQHRLEVELLLRLAENLTRGGAQNPQEVARMGAEARALIAALGPERVPLSYEEYAASTDKLRTTMADTSEPLWLRQSIEALLELQRTAAAHR
jgi:hypothetical protein